MRSLLFSVLLLCGCASTSPVVSNAMSVSAGMTPAQVQSVMGAPQRRTFRGPAEAWQYCSTGAMTDQFAVVWFVNGAVTALTQSTGADFGHCSSNMPEIDWGQVPPDVRIAIEH